MQSGSVWTRKVNKDQAVYFERMDLELLGEQPRHKLLLKCQITSHVKHKSAFLAFDISNSLGITVFQAIPQLDADHVNWRIVAWCLL